MFLQRLGVEEFPGLQVAAEIVVALHLRTGENGGPDGGNAGIVDGSGRQPLALIGVVSGGLQLSFISQIR